MKGAEDPPHEAQGGTHADAWQSSQRLIFVEKEWVKLLLSPCQMLFIVMFLSRGGDMVSRLHNR